MDSHHQSHNRQVLPGTSRFMEPEPICATESVLSLVPAWDNIHDSIDDLHDNADFNWQLTQMTGDPTGLGTWPQDSSSQMRNCIDSVPPPGIYQSRTPHRVLTPGLSISSAPAHLTTVLIEHWFRCVCPIWSTFDSDINYNRQLARTAWSVSEAVFYAMQAMSAAYLVDSMPQLKNSLESLRAQAAGAISSRVAQLKQPQPSKVTTDLVFAVFALGTSVHWSTPAPTSEHPWLNIARELLSNWQVSPSEPDALLHAYFCQALNYWEMLLAATGCGTIPEKIDRRRRRYQSQLRSALCLPQGGSDAGLIFDRPLASATAQSPLGTRPNSWCGVSSEVIDIFGQVLALCRTAHLYQVGSHGLTMANASRALCDISVAYELQRELLAMDFGSLISMEEAQGFHVRTNDNKTPVSHLLQTAEAYRQAALLQLKLAFSDLTAPDSTVTDRCFSMSDTLINDDTTSDPRDHPTFREEHVVEMALQLAALLEQIPIESGSRSLHAMLYISAAAGLRFNACSTALNFLQTPTVIDQLSQLASFSQMDDFPCEIDSSRLALSGVNFLPSSDFSLGQDSVISQSTLKVAMARRLVWTRLSTLQHLVPQSSRDNALHLVKNIWWEYDNSSYDSSRVHWFDVLAKIGCGTMFR
ncbi:hypothetical protein HJFPF1_00299 [Paramyrothecium foliicola]|nr:hypothetical protein HJFPF1_00299 [Paramyrothecium foliicola]